MRSLLAILLVLSFPVAVTAGHEGLPAEPRRVDDHIAAYLIFMDARSAALEGRNDRAAELLRDVLELDPGAPRVHTTLAEVCLQLRDVACAEASAERALELSGSEAEGHRVLAQVALGQFYRGDGRDRLTKALGHLKAAIDAEPDDATLWTLLIGVLAQDGRFDEATGEAARAASIPGADPARPWILLAKAMLSAGRRDDAIRLLETIDLPGLASLPVLRMLADLKGAVRDWNGQVAVLERLRVMLPDDAAVAHQLGGALYRVGDTYAALRALEDAVSMREGDPLVLRDFGRALFAVGRSEEALESFGRLPEEYLTAPTMILQSFAAEQAGRAGEAAGLWEAAAAKAADSRDAARESLARRRGARAYLAAGEPEAAFALLAPLDVDDVGLLALRVEALESAGRGEEGRGLVESARRLRPYGPAALAWLASRADGKGDRDAVAFLFDASRGADDPGLMLHRVALSLLALDRPQLAARIVDAVGTRERPHAERLEIRGRVLAVAGRIGEAEAAWRRLLELRPDNAFAMNELGYLLATEGRSLGEAVRLLERAVAAKPRSGSYLDSLGWAHHVSGSSERALVLLRQAVGLADASEMGVIRDHLGDVYIKLGDAERAVAEWRAALRFGGVDDGALNEKIRLHGRDRR